VCDLFQVVDLSTEFRSSSHHPKPPRDRSLERARNPNIDRAGVRQLFSEPQTPRSSLEAHSHSNRTIFHRERFVHSQAGIAAFYDGGASLLSQNGSIHVAVDLNRVNEFIISFNRFCLYPISW